MNRYAEINEFVGKTCTKIDGGMLDDVLTFHFADGSIYEMYHQQNCCERVWLEDINGELNDLIGVPMVTAYESSNNDLGPLNEYDESYTWTFYILAASGHVTLRWYGKSNGYYSERVHIICTQEAIK